MGQGSSVQQQAVDRGLTYHTHDGRSSSGASTIDRKSMGAGKRELAKERPRYGSVEVTVTSVSNLSRSRPMPMSVSYNLNSLGGLIHGTACDPHSICNVLDDANFSEYPVSPNYVSLSDSKAQSTLVAFTGDSWHVIPSKDPIAPDAWPRFEELRGNIRSSFSSDILSSTSPITAANAENDQCDRRNSLLTNYRNHTTCLVLGDRTERGNPQIIQLGDRLRLGSVILVVSAVRYNGEPEQVLDRDILRLHLDNQSVVLTEEEEENMAILAACEAEEGIPSQDQSGDTEEAQKQARESDGGHLDGGHEPSSSEGSGASSPVDSEKGLAPTSSTRPRSETETIDYIEGDSYRGGPPSPAALPLPTPCDGVSSPPSAPCTAPTTPLSTRGKEAEDVQQEGGDKVIEGGDGDGDALAVLAGKQRDTEQRSKLGLTRGERFICYMCYETHDTALDPLVAPCACRGDTRYLHVRCLQRWFHSSMPTMPDGRPALQRADGRPLLGDDDDDIDAHSSSSSGISSSGRGRGLEEAKGEENVNRHGEEGKSGSDEGDGEEETQYRLAIPQVVRTASNGSLACKICGAAYKTSFRRKSDGKKKDILLTDSVAPYIVLTVVTRHEGNPELYNTRFRINFTTGWQGVLPGHSRSGVESVSIGRSSNCDMVLDYRTVSTTHARISYHHNPANTLPKDSGGLQQSLRRAGDQGRGKYGSPRGCFVLEDLGSSNGTMLHLVEALPLRYDEKVRLRMGRCNVSLRPRRNRLASARYRLSKLLGAGIMTEDALVKSEMAKAPYTPQELQVILGRATESSRISPPPSTGASPSAAPLGASEMEGRRSQGSSSPDRASFSPRSPLSSPRRASSGVGAPAQGFHVLGSSIAPPPTQGLGPPSHHVFTGLTRTYDRDSAGTSEAGAGAGTGAGASSDYVGRYAGSSLGARMSRAVNPQAQTQTQTQTQTQALGADKQQQQDDECRLDDPGLLVPPLALTLDQRGLSQGPPPTASPQGSTRRPSSGAGDEDQIALKTVRESV